MISYNKNSFASICENGKKLTIYNNGVIECYIGIKQVNFGKGFFSLYNNLMKELSKEGKEEREEEIKDIFFEGKENIRSYAGLFY